MLLKTILYQQANLMYATISGLNLLHVFEVATMVLLNLHTSLSPTVSAYGIWSGWSSRSLPSHCESLWYGVPRTKHSRFAAICILLAQEAARCHLSIQGSAADSLWQVPWGKRYICLLILCFMVDNYTGFRIGKRQIGETKQDKTKNSDRTWKVL